MPLDQRRQGRHRRRPRDRLRPASLMSGGWSPTCTCISQSGGKLQLRRGASLAFVPGKLLPGQNSIGRRCARQLRARRIAWPKATPPARRRRTPPASRSAAAPRPSQTPSRRRARCARCGSCPRPSRSATSGKHFVDFQNDVTAADIALARARRLSLGRAREALHHDRHGDRPGQDQQHQRAGDPGASCAASAIPEVGTTTFRPPYTPVTFGAFAGRRPRRLPRPDPQDAAACLARAARRAVRERRPVAARLVLSRSPARACTPRSSAK